MSWSISAFGRASAVAERVKAEAEKITAEKFGMNQAEKNVVTDVTGAILRALTDQKPTSVVELSASGSLGTMNGENFHSLNIVLTTKYNFLE